MGGAGSRFIIAGRSHGCRIKGDAGAGGLPIVALHFTRV